MRPDCSPASVSPLTLGGLLKHLAAVEDHYSTTRLRGEPIGAPWDAVGWDGSDDWEFTFAADDSPDQLYALWDGADGHHPSLRRLLCDLIEEYGRHTGHAGGHARASHPGRADRVVGTQRAGGGLPGARAGRRKALTNVCLTTLGRQPRHRPSSRSRSRAR
jgi:hypothetical protein